MSQKCHQIYAAQQIVEIHCDGLDGGRDVRWHRLRVGLETELERRLRTDARSKRDANEVMA